MDKLYEIKDAQALILSVDTESQSQIETVLIANILKELDRRGFKLDLTNNGEFSHAYVENEWGNALLHLKSKLHSTLVVCKNDATLRFFFKFGEGCCAIADMTASSKGIELEGLEIKSNLAHKLAS